MKRELTPENIQELSENQIFVFGSNMNGNHAGGAARLAVEKFGAITVVCCQPYKQPTVVITTSTIATM